MKSYKKRLEEFSKMDKNAQLDTAVLVDFAIGKDYFRLPKRDELEASFAVMDGKSMAGGLNNLVFTVPEKMSWHEEKVMMESIITRLNTVPMTKELTCEQLIKLWELAHNKRRRQYMIGIASAIAIAGGILLARYIFAGKDEKANDTNDEVIDEIEIDPYDQDAPEVEINDDVM